MLIKRSQIAFEFLVLIGFLTIISFGFITASGIQIKEYSDNQNKAMVEEFASSLKRELDMASVVKEGYERTVSLPEEIDGKILYNISMQGSTLTIITEEYSYSVIIPETEGRFETNKNNLIRNTNNTVVIN